jgi:hypothetical protein
MLTISEYTMAPTKSPKRASFSLPASPFTKVGSDSLGDLQVWRT